MPLDSTHLMIKRLLVIIKELYSQIFTLALEIDELSNADQAYLEDNIKLVNSKLKELEVLESRVNESSAEVLSLLSRHLLNG